MPWPNRASSFTTGSDPRVNRSDGGVLRCHPCWISWVAAVAASFRPHAEFTFGTLEQVEFRRRGQSFRLLPGRPTLDNS